MTENEIEKLKDAITGQNFDGFGESFKQKAITIACDFMCVSFWNETDYYLKTSKEMLEDLTKNNQRSNYQLNEIEKQQENVFLAKEKYPSGTRIVLNSMGDDPNPIESGTRGTVKFVDDISTVHCEFDNGRSLGLIEEKDNFRALTEQELNEEGGEQGENDSPVLTM